jgi:4-alpha-glucanotransferase
VRARAELGLLDDVPAEERAAAAERSELLALLRAEGLLPAAAPPAGESGISSGRVGDSVSPEPAHPEPEPTEREIVLAMHQLLARTPCRLKLISPYDVLAEPRQPNLPGTVNEYPNWRLPLPATVDELRADPRVAEITASFQP